MALDGGKLRNIRMAKGISQERLAIMCRVNKRTIQRAEKGEPIAPETAAFIADAIEMPVAALRGAQMELFEPSTKAWNEVVLVPVMSGRRILDVLRKSFDAEITFEVEPTKANIEPLKEAAGLIEPFAPDPWRSPHEDYDPSCAELLGKQAELKELLPKLSELSVTVFLATYKAWRQVPRYGDEGMFVRVQQAPESVDIAIVVISDTSSTHLLRRPDDIVDERPYSEIDEIPF